MTKQVNNTKTNDVTPNKSITLKEFETNYIAKIASSGKALRDLIQQAGLVAMGEAFVNNNYDWLTKVLNTVENTCSKNQALSFKRWVEENIPCRYTKTKNGMSFRKNGEESDFNFQQAQAIQWFKYEQMTKEAMEELYGIGNFDKAIENLVKKAKKQLENDKVKPEDRALVEHRLELLSEIDFSNMDNGEETEETEAA